MADIPANASGNIFQHEPLDRSKTEVRLLRLTNLTSERIECEVSHVDLEFEPMYHAISYTWGPPTPTFEISINGFSYTVRENLYQFLVTYRKVMRSYPDMTNDLLWIDQICIDQSSTLERNHQVSMMADIYRWAHIVIIWLGPTTDHSPFAMEYLMRLLEAPNCDAISDGNKSYEPVWTSGSVNEISALEHLYSKPYWNRLWIVQEMLLASRLDIMWGEYMMPAHCLYRLQKTEWATNKRHSWIKRPIEELSLEVGALDRPQGQRKLITLTGLVDFYHFSQCTEVRDKVYAFRALLVPWTRETIKVDYEKTVEEVLTDAAVAIAHEKLWLKGLSKSDFRNRIKSVRLLGRAMLYETFKKADEELEHTWVDWYQEDWEEACYAGQEAGWMEDNIREFLEHVMKKDAHDD